MISLPPKRIGDLCEIITKGTTPTTLGLSFAESGVSFLRVQNIEGGKVDYEGDTLFIDSTTHQVLDRSQIRPGDILVSIAGTIGRSAVVPWNAPPLNCNQAIAILRTNGSVHPPFLRYWLDSPDAQNQMRGATVTGTISNLSLAQIGNLKVSLPPQEEQRRIAAILDKAEDLRTKRRVALAKLESLAEAIFLDIFGDPKINPKGWLQKAMADLFATSPVFGTMIPPADEVRGWLSIRVGNIQNWNLDLRDRKYVDLPDEVAERHEVKDGDLLLARAIASEEHLGKCIVAHPGSERWAFDSHLMRLRFSSAQAEPEFIRYLLKSTGGRALFLRASRRSAVQFNINTKEISGLRIPVPPVGVQREFMCRLATMEKLKVAYQASLSEMNALFASLQHRAFRGEL